MNVLIIGSGAREHAIAKALARSPQKPLIYCYGTSHNPGIRRLASLLWVGDLNNHAAILKQAKDAAIDMAIIGPEAPLEQGLADLFWEHGIATIGPKRCLAQIETSKAFTRDLLKKYHIAGSPHYRVFRDLDGVLPFLQKCGEGKYVVKANGLMGGKGVKVAGDHLHSIHEAYRFCQELHHAGHSFVIEEKLIGQEFSMLFFCDGHTLVPMPLIQDHKRAWVNDEGPNTGGMGSYSAANHRLPFLSDSDVEKAEHISQAVLDALTAEYRERYIGILYGSFIATKHGVSLIEFNARFGDPEAMNALATLESDFAAICQAMVAGQLSKSQVKFAHRATVCKYAVPDGYPDHPIKNAVIDISNVQHPDQLYFGAVDERDGLLYATGSRAIAVLGMADTIANAEIIAEQEMNRIQGQLYHRTDIGTDDLIHRRIVQMEDLRSCV